MTRHRCDTLCPAPCAGVMVSCLNNNITVVTTRHLHIIWDGAMLVQSNCTEQCWHLHRAELMISFVCVFSTQQANADKALARRAHFPRHPSPVDTLDKKYSPLYYTHYLSLVTVVFSFLTIIPGFSFSYLSLYAVARYFNTILNIV